MTVPTIHLALRFTLEIIGLFAYAAWGWSLTDGFMRHIYAGVIPAVVMALWGIFNVENDPSRSGNAPIVVSGSVRLLIEIAVFGGAGYAIAATGKTGFAILFLIVTIIHYAMTWKRVQWLLAQKTIGSQQTSSSE